ncbi:MAG: porphobilinogen synthase [Candidatus Eiseniibacteriota bacterium]
MMYPDLRMRRFRRSPAIRRMVRETRLSPDCLIAPAFVVPGSRVRQPLEVMPGVDRVSPDLLVEDAKKLRDLGIPAMLVFGLPSSKDAEGSQAWATNGPVPEALRRLREADLGLVLIADVCLCEYTDHGHCGVLEGHEVANDKTLPLLAKAAVAYARAGADVVAPSDMMDGRVGAIREALDEADCAQTAILSYAAKFASGFYGPFREAAQSAPSFGDRRGYQMDAANLREAMREIEQDLSEGADAIMVKPALAYLDVIRAARERTEAPLAAYNVSGEYAMVKAAAAKGWIEESRIVLEILTGIRRAGADWILTYHAADAARWLAEGKTA